MRIAHRIKKLADRTGLSAAERVDLVIVQGVRRDDNGELHTKPGFAMFPGHKGGMLSALHGETDAEFGTRARANLIQLKQARENQS